MAPIAHVFFNVVAVKLQLVGKFEVWCAETHLVGGFTPNLKIYLLVKLDRSSPQVGMNI